MDRIVSRHPATVAFIADHLLRQEWPGHGEAPVWNMEGRDVVLKDIETTEWVRIRVIAAATEGDVRGKVVYGNLPLHLASLAECVHAVEFAGPPPRGQEYTAEDMAAAGARLTRYVVREEAAQ